MKVSGFAETRIPILLAGPDSELALPAITPAPAPKRR
jgi:hypothetical protein